MILYEDIRLNYMNITPKEELEDNTLWFLRMIESEFIDSHDKNEIDFPFKNPRSDFSKTGKIPSEVRQRRVIADLEKEGVLEFKNKEIFQVSVLAGKAQENHIAHYNFLMENDNKHIQNYLIINKSKFEEVYKEDQELKNEIKIFFDEKNKQLCNSNDKKSQTIKGGPLRLLKCFLKNNETLKCKKDEILKTMGGQDQYSGARKQLLSLINGVAEIDSIHHKDSKKTVEYYQLKGL